jgi:hypothetical protein
MSKKVALFLLIAGVCWTQGCTRHEVNIAPVKVEPIHITIDVNIKVDRALDDFFSDVDEGEEESNETSSSGK